MRAYTPVGVVLLLAALAPRTPAPVPAVVRPAMRAAFADGKHRGMSFAHSGGRRGPDRGYGSPASAESLRLLAANGVNWISVMPYAFQATPQDTAIRWQPQRQTSADPDARFRRVITQAHAVGIRLMLKPHVWLRSPNWVGMISHDSDDAWAAWFTSYRQMILHFARLAQETGVDALCVGNELDGTVAREAEWRRLIRDVRATYDGPLTYGANFSAVEAVPFWDALDFIGLSAYYPLGGTPDRDALVRAWQPKLARLGALARRWHRQVVFTELGYRSSDASTRQPWHVDRTAAVNLEVQAAAYEAFFEAVWPEPWFGGVYWWKWFTRPDQGGPDDNDYSPHDKPAELVLRHYFRQAASGS